MAEATIPVDPFNPGQVFACLGFLEAADILLGGAEGGFAWDDASADVTFTVRAAGDEDPVAAVLTFVAQAEVASLAPHESANATEKWKVPTSILATGAPFPYPDPASPATLPAVLRAGDRAIVINYWGDATERDNVKFWAGAAGYPGAALARDALDLARPVMDQAREAPFSLSAVQSSSFRFDWRRDYIPMDVGFSPNDHSDVKMTGFPLVELLAAIGVTHARPLRVNRLTYRYGIIGNDNVLLAPMFLRGALGCARLPFRTRTFRMALGWPGQEGQARCITDVTEETTS